MKKILSCLNPLTRGKLGFTLLEIAIAMIILGLLLSGSIKLWSMVQLQNKRQATEQQLKEAIEALIGFALQNSRLPRPAQSATNGLEMKNACSNDEDCSGFLPWEELGLEKTDAWGKILRYSVSPKYAGGTSGNDWINLKSAGFNIGSSIEAKMILTINPADPATLVRMAHAIPAVVYSQGANNFGSNFYGKTLNNQSSNNIDEIANDKGSANNSTLGTRYVMRPPSGESHKRGEFDDQLRWLSPHVLKTRLVAAGIIP